MGLSALQSVAAEFGWQVHDEDECNVYDAETLLFFAGRYPTAKELRNLCAVYKLGFMLGEAIGRDGAKAEIRRALGAAGIA